MNVKNLLPAAKLAGTKVALKAKKHGPTIMVVAGVAGLVGTVVLACKETTKLDSVNEEAKAIIDDVKSRGEDVPTKDLTLAYVKAACKYIKLYAPSACLGLASTASILYGHGVISKRNAALLASYSALEGRFKDYRSRVMEKWGEDVENKLFTGEKTEEVEETVTKKDGTEKVVKHKVTSKNISDKDPNFLLFEEGMTPEWTSSPSENYLKIKCVLNWAQRRVNAGYPVFVNEVREQLGFKRIPEGQLLGWNKNDIVDFGLFENIEDDSVAATVKREFILGNEASVMLHFKNIHEIWSAL